MNLAAYLRQPFPLIHLARRRLKVNNHGMMRHDLLEMSTRFRLEFFFVRFSSNFDFRVVEVDSYKLE